MHHIRRLISVITFLGASPLLVIASAAADRQQPQFTQQIPPVVSESPAAGTSAPVFEDQQLDGILGKAVRSSADEDMGRIVDVLVSREGQLRAVVIDFGGFLGVGSRKVAVDWNALRFPAAGKLDRVTLELTRDQVRLAPEYRSGEPVKVVSAPSQLLPNASPLTEK
jgi:PRC-barrel domain